MRPSVPELLAPAGSLASLHAAVRAGADAVYLGVGDFNARRGADNFTLESLADACAWAHVRGVRVFLTVNTVVLPSETNAVMELVRQAYRCGVDAFIVQDVGVAAEMSRTLPEAELHISTQMNVHSAAGIRAAARLGAARVTLARELSLEEVEHLCQVAHGFGMHVEMFAHGALCICYSGQCFASSLIGGRSANRGMCAQACRLPYELHNVALRKPLRAPGDHLLSPKDLCTIDLLDRLVAAGVDSLKIEGRMKAPEYVFSVVSTYRAVLDRIEEAQGPLSVSEEEHQRLAQAFSRGFTQAYLTGETGNDMMSYSRPNNRGVRIGRVSSARDGLVEIECEAPIAAGDVIEFWTNKGHFAHTVDGLEDRGGARVACVVPKPVGKGDRVFRVRSADAAFVDDASEPRVAVEGSVELHIGKPALMRLQTLESPEEGGASVCVEGDLVEAARTRAVTSEDVRDHIDRFGTTPFALADLDVRLDESVGIGFSTLHHLRADAAERLQQALLAPWSGRVLPKVADAVAPSKPPRATASMTVGAWATNAACARAARRAGADVVYVPAINYPQGQATVAGQRSQTGEQTSYPKGAVIALPAIDHDAIGGAREAKWRFDAWAYAQNRDVVFVDSLGGLNRALEEGKRVEVGPHLPVTNAFAVGYLESLGVDRIWLSPELSLEQIRSIAADAQVGLGLFVSGSAELMITEHCLLQSQGPCAQDCDACPRRLSPHYLKDRKGYEMPVITDCCGRSHLYNAVPLDVLHLVPDLMQAGVSAFMVDTTLLNTAQTTEAVARAVRARDLAKRTGDAIGKVDGTTTGHMFRGVS